MEPIDPNVDAYSYIGLIKNTNGTVTRVPDDFFPTTPPCPDHVLTKDMFSLIKKKILSSACICRGQS